MVWCVPFVSRIVVTIKSLLEKGRLLSFSLPLLLLLLPLLKFFRNLLDFPILFQNSRLVAPSPSSPGGGGSKSKDSEIGIGGGGVGGADNKGPGVGIQVQPAVGVFEFTLASKELHAGFPVRGINEKDIYIFASAIKAEPDFYIRMVSFLLLPPPSLLSAKLNFFCRFVPRVV